jgi:hypothetical protein
MEKGGLMPPQVSGAGPGKGPVVVHSQDGVNETKSGNVPKKTSETQQNSSEPHRATPKEKSQKNLEKSMEISGLLNKIGEALGDALRGKEEKTTTKGKGNGSGSLTDLARTLGDLENKQAEKVKEKANKAVESQADSADLKAESQTHSVINDAVNTVVKGIGDAVSTAARK